MDWNWNTELQRHSISADPEVLRVLYERLQQQNAESRQAASDCLNGPVYDFTPKKVAYTTEGGSGQTWTFAAPYYTNKTWREAITVADAQWLHDLQISPL